jgi:hypothetical protein
MVAPLTERLDRLKRLVLPGAVPVLVKFALMSMGPFDHEPKGARRELAGDDLEILNGHLRGRRGFDRQEFPTGVSVLREKGDSDVLRESDTLARLGGDEFALVLGSPSNREAALRVADKVRIALADPFDVADVRLHVAASSAWQTWRCTRPRTPTPVGSSTAPTTTPTASNASRSSPTSSARWPRTRSPRTSSPRPTR